jgi:hypothetical protein
METFIIEYGYDANKTFTVPNHVLEALQEKLNNREFLVAFRLLFDFGYDEDEIPTIISKKLKIHYQDVNAAFYWDPRKPDDEQVELEELLLRRLNRRQAGTGL